MDITVITDKEINGLSSQLGYWLWNLTVSLAPYDTGNLRRAISLQSNSEHRKSIVYNAFNAIYLHYLEQGEGTVKKHTGFISVLTVGAFIQELIAYVKTGSTPIIQFSNPTASLRTSQNGSMFYENKMLRYMNISGKKITADDRRKLSQLRFMGVNNTGTQRTRGKSPFVRRLYNRSESLRINDAFIDPRSYDGSTLSSISYSNVRR